MFGYRPPGAWPLVRTYRSDVVHVRAGENFIGGTIRLRCAREVRHDRSMQFSGGREDATCTQCLRAVDRALATS